MINIKIDDYDLSIKIKEEKDIILARQMVKDIAKKLEYSLADITKLATATSELARNIFRYAKEGFIYIKEKKGDNVEIEILAIDKGKGIKNLQEAISPGFTTSKGSLGLGLSGIKRLMDTFYIESEINKGTVVIISKRRRTF